MAEQVYFERDGVVVTASLLRVNETTFPLAGLTSVASTHLPAERAQGLWTALLGAVLAFAALALQAGSFSFGLFIVGAIIFVFGLISAIMARPRWAVTITTASGQVRAVISKDRDYVLQIVNSLNDAIVARG